MDEELKKLIESSATETRRHFDVVAERLEKRFDVLSEAISVVDENSIARQRISKSGWIAASRKRSR